MIQENLLVRIPDVDYIINFKFDISVSCMNSCHEQQLFKRKQHELDEMTAEDIERSRRELSDLESKFLEKVAQLNGEKPISVGGTSKGRAPPLPPLRLSLSM